MAGRGPSIERSTMADINWLDEPEQHNYPAAESYLSLLYDRDTVAGPRQGQPQGGHC
jgi:hypothetical protein